VQSVAAAHEAAPAALRAALELCVEDILAAIAGLHRAVTDPPLERRGTAAYVQCPRRQPGVHDENRDRREREPREWAERTACFHLVSPRDSEQAMVRKFPTVVRERLALSGRRGPWRYPLRRLARSVSEHRPGVTQPQDKRWQCTRHDDGPVFTPLHGRGERAAVCRLRLRGRRAHLKATVAAALGYMFKRSPESGKRNFIADLLPANFHPQGMWRQSGSPSPNNLPSLGRSGH
jgi:hypothetical protein